MPFTEARTVYRLIVSWKPLRPLGPYICLVLLSAYPDCTYRLYSVFVGIAHECIAGMEYPDHHYCDQCGYCTLFHAGRHESCHLDRGHTGDYSDWRCAGMYVYLAFDMPEGPAQTFSIAMEDGNSAWEVLEAV